MPRQIVLVPVSREDLARAAWMLARKEHVRGAGLVPLLHVTPIGDRIVLGADRVRVEDDLCAGVEQADSEVEVLIAEGTAAGEVDVEAAERAEQIPPDRELPGQQVKDFQIPTRGEPVATVVSPFTDQ